MREKTKLIILKKNVFKKLLEVKKNHTHTEEFSIRVFQKINDPKPVIASEAFAERLVEKQSQRLGLLRFVPCGNAKSERNAIGHFFTWSTLKQLPSFVSEYIAGLVV